MSERNAPAAERLWRALEAPEDPAGLAAFRVLLGTILTFSILRFWHKGWIEELYLAPPFHFTYLGFDWVRPWPGAGMYVHFALLGVAALGVLLGAYTRLCAAAFCLLFTYAELIDKATYLNHYYFVSLVTLLLVFLPSEAAWSWDAWRRGKARAHVQRADYLVLRTQLGLVYFFAGFAKLQHDWLFEAQPLRIWLQAFSDWPLLGPLFSARATAYAMSWFGAVFDLTIPFWLSWRKSRAIAYATAVLFHVTIWLLFPIGVFSWVMLGSATIFFEPSWPRRLLRRLSRASNGATPDTKRGAELDAAPPVKADDATHDALLPAKSDHASSAAALPLATPLPLRRFAVAAFALYFAVQLALPLRYLAYPGWVNWTEEGFRFAWRVMLIEKSGQVEYDVRVSTAAHASDTDQRILVFPRKELTVLQYKMMSTQPDMIHEYALVLAERYRRRGYQTVRVYADAWASLNGRPSRRTIRPDVDLAAEPRTLASARFNEPLASER